MKLHVTEKALKEVVFPAARNSIKVFDTEVVGFGAQMTKTALAVGTGSYFVSFRDTQGCQRQEKIASVGAMAAHTARGIARLRLEEVKKSKGDGQSIRRPNCKTVSEFFYDTFLQQLRSEQRNYETHASLFRNHVNGAIGDKRLDEVTEADVLDLREALLRKPVADGQWKTQRGATLGESTVKRILILVRHIFNVALKEKVLGLQENPTRYLRLTAPRKVTGRFLTTEEIQRLVAVVENKDADYALIVKFLLTTGMRRGNVLKLRWSWVDFEQGTIDVPAQEDKAKQGFTKFLSKVALDILLKRFEDMKDGEVVSDWVFANPATGKPYHSRRALWVTCIGEAGLHKLRYHDLRHTFASMLLESGADISDVKKELGHTQLKTSEIYLHRTNARKRQKTNAASAHMGF